MDLVLSVLQEGLHAQVDARASIERQEIDYVISLINEHAEVVVPFLIHRGINSPFEMSAYDAMKNAIVSPSEHYRAIGVMRYNEDPSDRFLEVPLGWARAVDEGGSFTLRSTEEGYAVFDAFRALSGKKSYREAVEEQKKRIFVHP